MKIPSLTVFILTAGTLLSRAQSNPDSTNAVDVETQLAWPDGTVYINATYDTDYTIYGYGTTNPVTYFNTINWQLAGGGSSEQKYSSLTTTNFDDQYNWGASQWPDGYLNSDVNLPLSPEAINYAITTYGSADFTTSYAGNSGQNNMQWNDQSKVSLITGGTPNDTGFELYLITVSGILLDYTYPGFPPEFRVNFSQQQVQVGNLGGLTLSATNYGGQTYGELWASLPVHTTVPVTPQVSGSPYADMIVEAQGYQLVSQCVATTPTNQARTTIGVGEQVSLYFNPSLPTNAIWNTTAGGLQLTSGITNFFTAPSNAASVTVTATIAGKSVNMKFKVLEPSGVDHSSIYGLINYPPGEDGAGMTNLIWIAPTSVSFYRVNILEVGENASSIFGYFDNTNLFTSNPSVYFYHSTAGHWTPLGENNEFGDIADLAGYPSPWSTGGFTWDIPARWQVVGSGATNSMNGWNQVFTIDGNGTVTVQKFGHSVTRTTNDVYTTSN